MGMHDHERLSEVQQKIACAIEVNIMMEDIAQRHSEGIQKAVYTRVEFLYLFKLFLSRRDDTTRVGTLFRNDDPEDGNYMS